MKLFIVIAALLILFNDLLPLRKNKSKKELILLSSLSAACVTLAFLYAFGVALPSPITALDGMFTTLFKVKSPFTQF